MGEGQPKPGPMPAPAWVRRTTAAHRTAPAGEPRPPIQPASRGRASRVERFGSRSTGAAASMPGRAARVCLVLAEVRVQVDDRHLARTCLGSSSASCSTRSSSSGLQRFADPLPEVGIGTAAAGLHVHAVAETLEEDLRVGPVLEPAARMLQAVQERPDLRAVGRLAAARQRTEPFSSQVEATLTAAAPHTRRRRAGSVGACCIPGRRPSWRASCS